MSVCNPSSTSFIVLFFFFFNDTATTEIYTLSLHDALPIYRGRRAPMSAGRLFARCARNIPRALRSEEHTSELQSRPHLVCRLLLENKREAEHTQAIERHGRLVDQLDEEVRDQREDGLFFLIKRRPQNSARLPRKRLFP